MSARYTSTQHGFSSFH